MAGKDKYNKAKKGPAKTGSGKHPGSPAERRGEAKTGAGGHSRNPAESRGPVKARAGGQPGKSKTHPGTSKTQPGKSKTQPAKSGGRPGKSGGHNDRKDTGSQVRLNKYVAASGICSRREADQLITAGLIEVNGKRVTELGTRVNTGDVVRYNGQRIRNERKVYLLLNKPKDFVTTTDDPRERKTVMLLVKNACRERIYPVGRLDRNTTGVLLFTNDGDLAKKLTHPSHNKKKIYHVFLDKALQPAHLQKLAAGIELDDGFIRPDAISYVEQGNRKEVGLEIHSGRNRVVRRLFESLGYGVIKLDRVYFAGLTKKNLPRGKWRFLTEKEINMLRMNAYE